MSEHFVLLDGKRVRADEVDPARHRYLGMFRPPDDPAENATTYVMCWCGQILQTRDQTRQHYLRGCYDAPQYVTIEGKE